MEQQIRFCTSADGTRIGYAIYGDQPGIPMVHVNSWGHSIEAFWKADWSRNFTEVPAQFRRIIEFDRRGSGVSQREVDDLSLDAQVSDLLAVVDVSGAQRCHIVGWSDGCATAIAFAARHRQRVARLILCCPFASANRSRMGADTEQTARMIRENWSMARRAMATLAFPTGETERQRWWSQTLKEGMSPEIAARHYDEFLPSLNVTNELSLIEAPTLVLHFDKQTLVDLDSTRELATAIPDARFVPLAGELLLYADRFEDLIIPFLDEGTAPQPTVVPSGTAVILFADIVDSTALTEKLGDEAFRGKARELDGALRAAIRNESGRPIEGKLLGDGVLAVFTSARQAIEAALACGRAGDDSGLPLHLGLHAGDVIEEEGNVFGGAVNIASRVAGESGAGEVLVSQTVRDLARTSAGVAFEDAGERELKGVSEPVRVWRVIASGG
jgi:class 3 adenylate cyclase/predicted alpha/beta hydrolase family esterase